jgi:transposase
VLCAFDGRQSKAHAVHLSKDAVAGQRSRKRVICHDKERYRGRHLIENAFCRLKDFRRVHTRFDKLAANFLLGVALATAIAFRL